MNATYNGKKYIILIFDRKFAYRMYLCSKTWQMNTTIRIQHIWISLGTKFHLNQIVLSISTEFTKKWYSVFLGQRKNLSITIEFSLFELIKTPNIILNSEFWTKFFCFTQKEYFWSKREKLIIVIEFSMFWISLDPKFYL